ARPARVYYGDVSLHDYLERTVWHSGQHVRQLVMVLGMLGIAPDRPPTAATFAGLPMPEKVWDDERVIPPLKGEGADARESGRRRVG
ncbi:MAG TPA: hypothetical protein VEK73_03530, partial [Xanthobacteraceae bacterium]|nr:hypothetical protein [Xanthobacteraceae bacterium]